MAAITLASVEAALEQGLKLVGQLAPLAGIGGPAAGAIGTLVGELATWASATVTQVTSDAAIIGSGDVTKITALEQQLQAANASLNAQIAAS